MSKVKPLNSREISTFCSQTAIILKAGITPVEGMGLLRTDAATSEARAIYDQIFQVCSGGNSFYDGVAATGVFPDYVLNRFRIVPVKTIQQVLETALQTDSGRGKISGN